MKLLKTIMRYINTFFEEHEERYAFFDPAQRRAIVIDPLGNELSKLLNKDSFDNEDEAKQHVKDCFPMIEFMPLQHFMGHPKFMKAHRAGGFQNKAFFESVHKELGKVEKKIASHDVAMGIAKGRDDNKWLDVMDKNAELEKQRSALLDLLKLSSYEARADQDDT